MMLMRRFCWTPRVYVLIVVLGRHVGPTCARSVRISVSHQENFAVSDKGEQEVVSLDKLAPSLRNELEMEIERLDRKRAPIENRNMFMRKRRKKRALDLQRVANQDWEMSYTAWRTQEPGTATAEPFEIISEQDILRAKKIRRRRILRYVGYTLAAALFGTALVLCLIMQPKECIMAFGMGSPCCLILSPCCIACLGKISDPQKMMRDNMNCYAPGLIIYEDGTTEYYDPSPEEMDCLEELMGK